MVLNRVRVRLWILTSMLSAVLISGCQAQSQITEHPYIRGALDATGFDGSMLIYQLKSDHYLGGHSEAADILHIPASTFKIMSSLAALQTGVIADTGTIMPWDGIVRGRAETNTDMDLRNAFQISSVPHYQELVRQIGHERIQSAVDAAQYGNQNISGGIDTFWLEGEMRISPRQQIELLKRLYHDELPFAADVMAAVRDIMVLEQTVDYVLRAKTGLAVLNDDEYTGWWVGWVEHEDEVTFFATVLTARAPGDSFIPSRLSVTRDVLQHLGAL
jgi:beta-lactamase class D